VDEINTDETDAAACGVVGRGGPAGESRENWADAARGGGQRRPGVSIPPPRRPPRAVTLRGSSRPLWVTARPARRGFWGVALRRGSVLIGRWGRRTP